MMPIDRWPMIPLKELVENTQYGTALKANDQSLGVPVLRMNNITYEGRICLENLKHVVIPEHEADKFTLRYGDLLFNRTNSRELVGKTAVWDRPEAFAYAGYLVRLRVKRERVEPRYVSAWFNSTQMKAILRTRAKPSINMSNISASEVLKFEVPLPPLPEQRRIAEILDKADELRAKRRAALAQLDTLTQSIFLDMFGDPATNPKGWPVTTIGTMLATSPIFGTMIPPTSGSSGEWLSLRVANIQEWQLDLSDQKFLKLPQSAVERHSVRDGDLLLARAIASQEHLGKAIVAYPGGRKWAFDSHLMRLRFDREVCEPEFMRCLLRTDGGRKRFLGAARRSAVQFNINTKEIAALRVPIAPIGLQRSFVDRVASVEKIRRSQLTHQMSADVLFASLQHRAFRGEL